MLTEQIKIKLHNALFAASFKPLNFRRRLWTLRNEISYTVVLNATDWNFCEDTSSDNADDVFAYGGYSDNEVEQLLALIANS